MYLFSDVLLFVSLRPLIVIDVSKLGGMNGGVND